MPTYKNSNITDFFKAYKRPLPEDEDSQSQPARKSRSSTPPNVLGSLPIRSCENTPSKRRANVADLPAVQKDYNAPTQCRPDPGDAIISNGIEALDDRDVTEQLPFPSSQGPIPTSSQRVVKNGEAMVTNSDEEGSDTDESLRDIDELLRARRPPPEPVSSPLTEPDSSILTPTQQSTPAPEPDTAIRNRRTRGTNASARSASQANLSRKPKYKFDLASLVKQAQTDGASEEGIAKARSLLATLEANDETATAKEDRNVKKPAHIDAGLVASVMKDRNEDYDATRLMLAIERTGALQQDSSWSFFEESEEASDAESQDFPDSGMAAWQSTSHGPAPRQQAFLGGSMGALAVNGKLPDEVLIWLFDSVSLEPRDDLRYTYIHTLKDAGQNLTPIVDTARIDAAFRRLGASSNAMKTTNSIVPTVRSRSKEEKVHQRPRLMSLIKILGDLATDLERSSRNHIVCLLCRLLVDHTISHDTQAIITIEEALESLISAIPEAILDDELSSISTTIFTTLSSPPLQYLLLQGLPAFSSRLTFLRRRLALAFFFSSPTHLSLPPPLLNLGSISHRLTSPQFRINKHTNYTDLASLTSILNVAIGNGDPPLAGLNPGAEELFNRDIDELAKQIKGISTSIIDAGASQLKRTEAKEALESLHFRLIYAVRTREKEKNMMFQRSVEKEREVNDHVWDRWRGRKDGAGMENVGP